MSTTLPHRKFLNLLMYGCETPVGSHVLLGIKGYGLSSHYWHMDMSKQEHSLYFQCLQHVTKKNRTSNQRVATTMQCRIAVWSQMQLLHHMWFCGCCCHAAYDVMGAIVRLYYIVVMVTMLHVVSWLLLLCHVVLLSRLHHVWCCHHSYHMCVAIAVTMVCVVSQALLSGCIMSWSWSPCHMWCYGHYCHAMWCYCRGYATCSIVVTVVVPCGVTVVVAVIVPLVPQLRSSL